MRLRLEKATRFRRLFAAYRARDARGHAPREMFLPHHFPAIGQGVYSGTAQ